MHPIIIAVSSLPPPYHGQSVAFLMLVNELKRRNIRHRVINISAKSNSDRQQSTWARSIDYARILLEYVWKALGRNKLLYLTISQSRRGFFRDFLIILFARINGHRIVCHLHGGKYDKFYYAQPNYIKYLIRKTLTNVDIMLVLGDKLVSMFDFLPSLRERIHVLPNGLPPELETTISPKTLSSNTPIRILYLSNLIESKGYFDLLIAISHLVNRHNISVECNFCGLFLTNNSDDIQVSSEEQAKKRFFDFIEKHGLGNNVFFKGVVTGTEKSEILKSSHIFVLPTNYDNEGQPISIIEAIAYGNVVISTDFRAIPDLIINEKTGFLVPYGDPEAITQRILQLARNPHTYYEISKNSLNYYQDNFTSEHHLNNLISFLSPTKTTSNRL